MPVEIIKFLANLAIFVFSVVIHEVSHARCAYYLGDPTAKNMGRLSLNPLKHISLLGVIIPIGLYLAGVPMFGFAKPVIYNPVYFRKPKRDMILVGLSGPCSNFILAIIAFVILFALQAISMDYFNEILGNMMIMNLILCFFNLLPIPPLDGSIIYMSSIIDRNPKLAEKVGYYGFGVLASLIIFMPLIGKALGQDYNLIDLYMKGCFKILISIMSFTFH
ncbi:MAG: site-2 protease family protein [Candidatus Rickettsia vulgarisii]